MRVNLISYKICDICLISKISSDFINNNGECYKCVYQRKVLESKKNYHKKCHLCDEKIIEGKSWKYCSKECAAKAKRQYRHWSVTIKYDSTGYKKRFMNSAQISTKVFIIDK